MPFIACIGRSISCLAWCFMTPKLLLYSCDTCSHILDYHVAYLSVMSNITVMDTYNRTQCRNSQYGLSLKNKFYPKNVQLPISKTGVAVKITIFVICHQYFWIKVVIKAIAYVLQTALYCGYRDEYDRINKLINIYAIAVSTYRQASFHC